MKKKREKISKLKKCGLIVTFILFASCSNVSTFNVTQIDELYSDKTTNV